MMFWKGNLSQKNKVKISKKKKKNKQKKTELPTFLGKVAKISILASTVWKFQDFSVTKIFMWNWIRQFWGLKNCYFDLLSNWILTFLEFLTFFKRVNEFPQKLLKWQFLTFWNQPKSISRKIRLARKLQNFHTVS